MVDDHLQTSDPDIFAIGEIALHRNMIYGLVAPGYAMADIAGCQPHRPAANLLGRRSLHQAQADGCRRRQLRQLPGRPGGEPGPDFRGPVPAGLQEAAVQPRRQPAAGRHPGRRRDRLRHAAFLLQERRSPARRPGRIAARQARRAGSRSDHALHRRPTAPRFARATTSASSRCARPSATAA